MNKVVDERSSAKLANMAFVCAVLVVLIHVSPRPQAGMGLLCKEFIWGFLSRIAVPFFFFASGYFLVGHYGEPGWWMRSLRNRLRSIGIPFVIWSLLYWCLLYAYEVVMRGVDSPLAQSYCSFLNIARIFGVCSGCPFLSPLWYCRNLILLVVISQLLCLALKRARRGICSLAFMLLAVWQSMPEKRWPQFIVSSAFPIYLIHLFFIFMMKRVFSKLPCTSLTYVLNGICVVSLTFLTVVLIRKLLPRAANVAFGGR